MIAGISLPRVPTSTADDSGPRELERFQGYLEPAPLGMDVRYAWSLPGGKGENVRIVDIEYDWNLDHNDLIAATADLFLYVKGNDPLPELNVDHGTAVLGELVAADDGIGVTGIAHKARIGLVNPVNSGNNSDVAGAIRKAVTKLAAGDIILLEQQSVQGPRFDPSNGRGLVPIEYEPDVFTAVREATQQGIVVIESAANGFEDLDHPAYNGAFNPNQRDSGAILVGAGLPEGGVYGPGPDRTRTPESNWGSRVDVQGWGKFVATCGYGELRREQGPNNWYTIDFGATSGATAMVAGACALIQSILKARDQAPLSSVELRRLLVSTGSPQSGNLSEHIGPRPDLRAAIDALDHSAETAIPRISKVKLKGQHKLTVDGQGFVTGDSVIEIDGVAVKKMKYPAEFTLPNSLTTRIVSKGDISDLIHPGQQVMVTVFTPSSGQRSEPFPFQN